MADVARMKEEAALESEYQMMRQQCQQLTYKINELKMDADEHALVIDALAPLHEERKCFRMIDAVVVERTVAEVLPAVQKNKEQARLQRGMRPAPSPLSCLSIHSLATTGHSCLATINLSPLSHLSLFSSSPLSTFLLSILAYTMTTLEGKLKEMQAAADEFKLKHKITSRDQVAQQEQEETEGQGGQGVLI
ncbi:MAG: hypothetical protein SGPRY_011328 [Prymnesium sp.]